MALRWVNVVSIVRHADWNSESWRERRAKPCDFWPPSSRHAE
jgi:hypothetical protein